MTAPRPPTALRPPRYGPYLIEETLINFMKFKFDLIIRNIHTAFTSLIYCEKNLTNEKSPYQGGHRLRAVGWDGSGRLGRVPVAPLGLTSGRLLGLLSKVGPGVATSGSGGSVCGFGRPYFLIGGDFG
jgi:hypothetical protein